MEILDINPAISHNYYSPYYMGKNVNNYLKFYVKLNKNRSLNEITFDHKM